MPRVKKAGYVVELDQQEWEMIDAYFNAAADVPGDLETRMAHLLDEVVKQRNS